MMAFYHFAIKALDFLTSNVIMQTNKNMEFSSFENSQKNQRKEIGLYCPILNNKSSSITLLSLN